MSTYTPYRANPQYSIRAQTRPDSCIHIVHGILTAKDANRSLDLVRKQRQCTNRSRSATLTTHHYCPLSEMIIVAVRPDLTSTHSVLWARQMPIVFAALLTEPDISLLAKESHEVSGAILSDVLAAQALRFVGELAFERNRLALLRKWLSRCARTRSPCHFSSFSTIILTRSLNS